MTEVLTKLAMLRATRVMLIGQNSRVVILDENTNKCIQLCQDAEKIEKDSTPKRNIEDR